MRQEMSLRTPDPLSAFRGKGLGMRLALPQNAPSDSALK